MSAVADIKAAHTTAAVRNTFVVIGLPRRLSGEPNEQTARVQAFAARLAALTPIPIVLQDERLSSHEAEELLARSEKDWRKVLQYLGPQLPVVKGLHHLDVRDVVGHEHPRLL